MITDAWAPVWGGGQEHIWQTSKLLVEKYGCQINVLVPNLSDSENHPQVEIHYGSNLKIYRLGSKFKFPSLLGRAQFLVNVLSWELTHTYDIYHSQASDSFLLPIVKIFKPNSKYIYTVHGAGVKLLNGGMLNSFAIPQRIWKFIVYDCEFDALLTAAKSTILKKTKSKIFSVIGNGVDIDSYDKLKVIKDSKVFKVVWIGRENDPIKGVRFLRNAVDLAREKKNNLSLKIITNKYGNEKIKTLKESDLFVLPSLSEGLPLVLLESMAASVPVVTTDVGDCGRIVRAAKNGLVVPPGRSDLLAQAILKLMDNRNIKKLGENGHTYVKANYSWEKVTDEIFAVYQKVLKK